MEHMFAEDLKDGVPDKIKLRQLNFCFDKKRGEENSSPFFKIRFGNVLLQSYLKIVSRNNFLHTRS